MKDDEELGEPVKDEVGEFVMEDVAIVMSERDVGGDDEEMVAAEMRETVKKV